MKSGVYIIINLSNNKIYVGESCNVQGRLRYHKSRLRQGTHDNSLLQNAFNYYGEDKFEFDVLEYCDIEITKAIEHHWCNMLLTHDRRYGYNLLATHPEGVQKHSEETKLRLSKIRTGSKRSEVSKNKQSKTLAGKKLPQSAYDNSNSYWRGRSHTEESKKLISEAKKGKKFSKEINDRKGRKGNYPTAEQKELYSKIRKEWWRNKRLTDESLNR